MGGDTIWANTVTAYESLPDELRDLADKLRIMHTNAYDYAAVTGREERPDSAAGRAARSSSRRSTRPSIRPSGFIRRPGTIAAPRWFRADHRRVRAAGLAGTDRILQDHITRPEHTARWQWRVGDLAIWDNRATQHYAIFDYGTEHRRGERVTVAGPVPVGVDGRPSVALTGEASAYYAGAARHHAPEATMSTQPTSAGGRRPPVYKRRRRRIYGTIAVAASRRYRRHHLGGHPEQHSGTAIPGFTIAYGQGTVANSDSIIASDPALAKTIPATLHFVPFDAGVTAIAEMRSGSLEAISGVGNPPVVGAIGTHTGVDVVIAQSFDADALIVPQSIRTPAQLAGKSVGVLVGSSEDYELRGWLGAGAPHVRGQGRRLPQRAGGRRRLPGRLGDRGVRAGGAGSPADRQGRPPAGRRGADRQAGHPRPERGRGRRQLVKSDPALVQKYVCAEVRRPACSPARRRTST